MNILLTGGAGYIGSHTAIVLTEAGHKVVIYDNFCNSYSSTLDRLQKILNKNIPLVEGDVRNTALLTKALQDFKIDVVMHFAGLKAVGESVIKPIEYYANNTQGTISLLEAMNRVGIRSLIFSSSATVYGNPQYLPIDENHPTSATNAYGRSKLHIEEMLKDVSYSDPNWRIICLRYFNPIGAHESGMIGEAPRGRPNNLLPLISKVAGGRLPKVTIFGIDYPTPDGTGIRDYIHVMDLAKGHLAALNFNGHKTGWDVINLGTGAGISVLEIINEFERVSGRNISYSIEKRRAGDVASCYATADKALKVLNWRAQYTPKEMCASAWLWERNNC